MQLREIFIHSLVFPLFCLGVYQANAAVDTIALPNAGLEISLNESTGLVEEMISTEPTVRQVSGQMEIFCNINGVEYIFDTVVGSQTGQTSSVFFLKSSPIELSPFEVRVDYSWLDGEYFQEKVSFIAARDILEADGCKIGFRHEWNPSGWSKLIGGTRPVRAIPASQPTLYAYGRGIDDSKLTQLDQYQSSILPLFVAESDDRFLLAGDFSVDSFVTLSPNYPQNSFPSVQRNPLSMEVGQTLSLTVNLRSFSGEANLLRDVWRWFINNLYSDDAEIDQYLTPIRENQIPMGAGNWCAFTYYKEKREDRMPAGSHIWWSMWHDQIRERYLTEGEWYVNIPWENGLMSAERQKGEIARIIRMGHKPHLYFRNLVNMRSLKHGHIKPSWIKKAETGDYERYGTGRGIGWDLPPNVVAATGYKRVEWGFLNWSIDEMRDSYFQSFVDCINYYQPKGIGMDFSWKGNELEIHKIQGRMCKWLRENHPDMKVSINDASGSPGQLLADVVLIENGYLGGKTWYDVEVAKAYRTNIATLERFNLFEAVVAHLVTGKKTWICESGINDVKRLLDYLDINHPELTGDIIRLEGAAHLRAGMRDISLGSAWGYIEECAGHELVTDFAGEINGLTLLSDSFAVQLPSGSDRDGNSYASAWVGDDKLRVALFNDNDSPLSTTVKIKVDEKWAQGDNVEAFVVTPLREKYSARVKKSYQNGMLELQVNNLSPFSLLTISLDDSVIHE